MQRRLTLRLRLHLARLIAGSSSCPKEPAVPRKYLRTPRRMSRGLFKRQTIGHTRPGIAYAVGNSFRGLRAQARWFRWADRDIRKTHDGTLVVNHWVVKSEGWRSNGHGDITKGIEGNVWADVKHWTARGGYRIHTVYADLAYRGARQRGRVLGRYLEPKRPHDLTLTDWQQIKSWAVRFGVPVKGYTLRANRAQLPLMNAAGINSHALRK